MNPPPIGEEARDRILRETRMKDAALEEGRRQGRMEAAAEFERRLGSLERRFEVLWRAFETDDTKIIRQPEGPNSG